MKVLLLAPNAGVSLSTGGGTNFVLKQAKAIADLGHQVVLAGFHALPLGELERRHGVALGSARDRIRVIQGARGWEYGAQARLPGKVSPYLALFDPRVARWLGGLGDRVRPDVTWFHDDIPVAADAWSRRGRRHVYVHFPLRGRSARLVPPLRSSRGAAEAAQDALLRRWAARLVVDAPADGSESVRVNSRVTERVVRTLWGGRPEVLWTYVPTPDVPPTARRREVVCLGAFHRGKRVEQVVEAFRDVSDPSALLTVVGTPRDPRYLDRVRRAAARSPGDRRIRFEIALPRPRLEEALARSVAIVHAARFEPFGLSVLEGMAHGLHPIVSASEYSGAWTDLTERGKFGTGFTDGAELGRALAVAVRGDPAEDAGARARADAFSESQFAQAWRGLLG